MAKETLCPEIGFFPFSLRCPRCNGTDFTAEIGARIYINANREARFMIFHKIHKSCGVTCTTCQVSGVVEDFLDE
jgi:hypothetical protein